MRIIAQGSRLHVEVLGLSDSRAFDAAEVRKLRDWAATYRRLAHDALDRESTKDRAGLGSGAAETKLRELGQAMFTWLDGDGRWLSQPLAGAGGSFSLELATQTHPTAEERAFLEAPWELLAWSEGSQGKGFLAGDAIRRVCIYRRLGLEPPAPAKPDDYRLGVTFMAASPRFTVELDFEAEENAIIRATQRLGIDLEVEDSGNLGLLAGRLAELDAMQVVHLSCHGTDGPPPALALEDEEGNEERVTAPELSDELQAAVPRLLFLSACLTAAGGKSDTDPLVGAMVRAGIPAVLGWDGSVHDGEATRFAAILYSELQKRVPLEAAVATARRQLLTGNQDHRPARDWHLARLWLGPAGGGALVSGRNLKRRVLGEEHGFKAFLDKRRGRSPVASREAFVGRRRELQHCLEALRGEAWAGVLIHGMGRLGKSSLAARLASRLTRHAPAVLFENYGARDLLAELRTTSTETAALIDQRPLPFQPAVEALELLLREILEGPASGNAPGKPVLLVIDDFEQLLDDPAPGGLHRVKAEHQAVMTAILRAFDPARTESRLIITSRYRFTLPERDRDLADKLHGEQLSPMHSAGARKQAQRRDERHQAEGKVALQPALVERAITVAHGHPGLQDLLFDLIAEAPAKAEAALQQMETYLKGGSLPDEVKVRDHLLNLTLEHLLGLLSPSERDLLKAMTLFALPVPLTVLQLLEDAVGGKVARLMALGLADRFEDLVQAEAPAAAVNAMVEPLLGELGDKEAASLAGIVVEPLLAAWGGEDRRNIPSSTDIELTRLALLAGHARVAAICAPWALQALDRQFAYQQAGAWAKAVMALLEPEPSLVSVRLLRLAADAVVRIGEPEPARDWLARAATMIDADLIRTKPTEAGGVLLSLGHTQATKGVIDEALAAYQRAHAIFSNADRMEREAAIATGYIAQIRAQQGAVEEALRLHRERLQVYERLGDVRERAVTLGEIAQIRAQQGAVEEALRLHQEELQVYERLGDVRSRAVTLGEIAQIRRQQGAVEEAVRLFEETLQVYERLGDVRSRAVTLGEIARIRAQQGAVEEALRLHQEELQVYERLGDVRSRAVTLGEIAQIRAQQGAVEEALRLHRERLQVYERLGDVRERAVTLGEIAQIRAQQGAVEEAVRLLEEKLKLCEQIGEVRSRAVTLGQIAQIRRQQGAVEEAVRLFEETLQVYERLGDVRSRAVTLGEIAQIRAQQGAVEEALALLNTKLAVIQQLGDVRSRLATLWSMGQIHLEQGDAEKAIPEIMEAYSLALQIGELSGISVIGALLGQIIVMMGEREQGLAMLRASEAGFRRLGQPQSADRVAETIRRIESEGGGAS